MAQVLVTGGAGFIGSNITERLVRDGHETVVLDDCFLGCSANVKDVVNRIEFVKGSVLDKDLVSRVMEGVDYVFHEAAHSSAPMFKEDPRPGIAVNVDGFLNVMEEARKAGVRRVVYASTSSLYSAVKPPHREDVQIMPGSWYEFGLFCREHISRLYYKLYGLESVGLRYFSVYGPHEEAKGKYANLISQFLWDMKAGKRPVVYGDGSQTRDFTFVDDVVEANMLALAAKGVAGDVFNVGTGKTTSINGMIGLLNKAMKTDLEPEYVKNPISNYVQDTLADTKKAEKLLKFRAKVALEEGIRKLVSRS